MILAFGPPLPGTSRRLRAWNVSGWSSWLPAAWRFETLAEAAKAMPRAKKAAAGLVKLNAGRLQNFAIVGTSDGEIPENWKPLEYAMRDLVFFTTL